MRARSVNISGGMNMILNDLSSMRMIGRALPRAGASLALAASLFGAGAVPLVHAQGSALAVDVDGARLPYIVCGIDSRLDTGGHQSILLADGVVPVSPAQI